ncbi:MAG: transporter substrate-binding domain-containing protein [Deltaproteobacteria bacterium]|nr:transporter substrate-binding domain-containing protein [Candidatus Zymogenaceae bacterium]
MKRRTITAMILACALLLFGSIAHAEDGPAASITIGWIMECQGLGDNGYNDIIDSALTDLEKETGVTVIRTPRMDLFTDQALYDLLNVDVDVIITSDEGGLNGAVSEAARSNPDISFIILGAEGAPLMNLASVIFEENEVGYMAGFIAGTITDTKSVGFVGGAPFESILRTERGFVAGVADADPSVDVAVEYVGEQGDATGLYDQEKIKAASLRIAGSGADVLFAAAGSGAVGTIYGAERMDVCAIGVDHDMESLAPNTVSSSVIYRYDVPVKMLIEDIIHGTFSGGIYTMGFENGGLDIADPGSSVTASEAAKIKDRARLLAGGKIDVPDYLDERRGNTIVVTHRINHPPYEFLDDKGNSTGYLIDVMEEIGSRMGREVIFKSFTEARIESGLETSRSDIEPMIMLDEERTKSYLISAPWGITESVLIVPDDDLSPSTMSELLGKTVAVRAGSIEEAYVHRIPSIFVENFSTTELALFALARGDVDAVVADRESARFSLSEKPLKKEDLKTIDTPVFISPYGVAMPKPGDEAFLAEIERVLENMEADGTLEKIREHWFR